MKIIKTFRPPTWLPAIALMLAIFAFSSIPSNSMPSFDWADLLIKKGAHALGYGLLAIAYLYAFQLDTSKWKVAWFLAFLYAMSDEYHQSFVVGRHASWADVAIDSVGAIIALKFLGSKLKSDI